VQERARTLADVYAITDFLYRAAPVIDPDEWEKGVRKNPAFAALLAAARDQYAIIDWTTPAIRDATAAVGQKVGVPQLGKAQAPIRLAVTGRSVGPPLFESLELLGRDQTLTRLSAALDRLQGESGSG
jgi:glutamyl-tRNA synthetase